MDALKSAVSAVNQVKTDPGEVISRQDKEAVDAKIREATTKRSAAVNAIIQVPDETMRNTLTGKLSDPGYTIPDTVVVNDADITAPLILQVTPQLLRVK